MVVLVFRRFNTSRDFEPQPRGVIVFLSFLENVSERQILWSLCSVVFHALTLRLPIQTLHSVAPEFT